jgi:hypothetical protein
MNHDTVRKAPRVRPAVYLAWSLVISLTFLWQAASYSGLIALSAEWQFGLFGAYRPAFTFLVFTALLTGIPLLIDQRLRKAAPAFTTNPDWVSNRYVRWLLGSAAACFALSLFCLGQIAFLPEGRGPVRQVDAASPSARFGEGPVVIHGWVLQNRSAALKEDLWFVRQELRVAPVIASGADGAPVRFWVELPNESDLSATSSARVQAGILRKNALPGELIHLYRSAGFTIAPDHYLLFRSPAAMSWPYRRDSIFWFSMGLLLLLGAAAQRLHQRHVRRRARRQAPAST